MTRSLTESYYTPRIKRLEGERKELARRRKQLALFRFISIIGAFSTALLLWKYSPLFSILCFLLLLTLFIFFLIKDISNQQAIENKNRLLELNQTEIRVLNHDFTHLPEGVHFADSLHPYSDDLDIFGRSSVFQYINRTTGDLSAYELANILKTPCPQEDILLRQEAVRELAAKDIFRQQLQASGLKDPLTNSVITKVTQWLCEDSYFSEMIIWRTARWFLPAISLSALLLYILNILPGQIFTPVIILMMMIAYAISKRINPAHSHLSRTAPQLSALSDSVLLIESTSFTAIPLQKIKNNFVHEPATASAEIRKLTRILERFDYKLNFIIHIPLNTFLFWDLQQMFALDNWKKRNRNLIGKWFHGLSQMEALSSMGTLLFNHPDWTFPEITDQNGVFECVQLGHPLIKAEKRVSNSFSTHDCSKINLITGSNMAGKSTFLRSIGVNIVLAMAGCPVCAFKMKLSYMKVMTSMRISDNLEESTSTFYAELKKLKKIIEAVNSQEKVFILLDEILRGTNSADRHSGSKALIRQLIHHKATGVLATHDIELAKMEEEFPENISNYHFDVQVANEELYFDYKLKEGVCTSMNASILMKKIGIEL